MHEIKNARVSFTILLNLCPYFMQSEEEITEAIIIVVTLRVVLDNFSLVEFFTELFSVYVFNKWVSFST